MVKVRNADFERELHLEEERFTVTKIQGFRKAFLRNREPFFPSIPLEVAIFSAVCTSKDCLTGIGCVRFHFKD